MAQRNVEIGAMRQRPISDLSRAALADRVDSRISSTLSRHPQQASSHQEQVGQCRRDLEAAQILGQSPVADLLESEHALDHADYMLDLGPHPGLGAVLSFLDLIDPAVAPINTASEVARARMTAVWP